MGFADVRVYQPGPTCDSSNQNPIFFSTVDNTTAASNWEPYFPSRTASSGASPSIWDLEFYKGWRLTRGGGKLGLAYHKVGGWWPSARGKSKARIPDRGCAPLRRLTVGSLSPRARSTKRTRPVQGVGTRALWSRPRKKAK